MMNRFVSGLGLAFMLCFSLWDLARGRGDVVSQSAPSVGSSVAMKSQVRNVASVVSSAPVVAVVAATNKPSRLPAAESAPIQRMSFAEVRRLVVDKRREIYSQQIDPLFASLSWVTRVQPRRREQMQDYLEGLLRAGVLWSSQQILESGQRAYVLRTAFRILTDGPQLRARADLQITFEGQGILQTSFEDEARLFIKDGRPFALFDLSPCPTDIAEHFAIILVGWPNGFDDQVDIRVLKSDEAWLQFQPHWVRWEQEDVPTQDLATRPTGCSWH